MLGALVEQGIVSVYHYAPLHYLPFIVRERALLSKPTLMALGYGERHLRSKSYRADGLRGFGSYAFLTLDRTPRILAAKLQAGFPHVGIAAPVKSVESVTYSLCRYNVAMTRYLKRGLSAGFPESPSNGRYYDGHEIPVARTDEDKSALLGAHLGKSMIEVLIHGDLPLTGGVCVDAYNAEDAAVVRSILERLGADWTVSEVAPPGAYNRRAEYVNAVESFIEQAIQDPEWRGDGLEFDRV